MKGIFFVKPGSRLGNSRASVCLTLGRNTEHKCPTGYTRDEYVAGALEDPVHSSPDLEYNNKTQYVYGVVNTFLHFGIHTSNMVTDCKT